MSACYILLCTLAIVCGKMRCAHWFPPPLTFLKITACFWLIRIISPLMLPAEAPPEIFRQCSAQLNLGPLQPLQAPEDLFLLIRQAIFHCLLAITDFFHSAVKVPSSTLTPTIVKSTACDLVHLSESTFSVKVQYRLKIYIYIYFLYIKPARSSFVV